MTIDKDEGKEEESEEVEEEKQIRVNHCLSILINR